MYHRKLPWLNAYPRVELAINPDGVSSPPFADAAFPIHVGFHIYSGPRRPRTRRHEHPEIIYVYAGSTEIQVQERSFTLARGDLMLLGPNLYHRILGDPKTEARIVSLNFHLDLIRPSETDADGQLYLLPLLCQDTTFPHVIPAFTGLPRRIVKLMVDIHDALPPQSALDRLAVKTRIRMLLLSLVEYYRPYLHKHGILDRRERDILRLRPLFQFLERHYDQRVRVADAARLCAMSSSHFMRFFKGVTAEPFSTYLSNFRIAKAQALLASSDAAVGDISDRVAFCSQSYFGKVFLERVGMTPLTYRRYLRMEGKAE